MVCRLAMLGMTWWVVLAGAEVWTLVVRLIRGILRLRLTVEIIGTWSVVIVWMSVLPSNGRRLLMSLLFWVTMTMLMLLTCRRLASVVIILAIVVIFRMVILCILNLIVG